MGSSGAAKKRKRQAEEQQPDVQGTGRDWTVSVAIPGSAIADAQCHELRLFIAGQIARALSVFAVDEVVVFNDGNVEVSRSQHQTSLPSIQLDTSYTGISDPNHFLAHILSYLEAPPALRRYLFPLHPNLKNISVLPELELSHHIPQHVWSRYRDGVTLPNKSDDDYTLVDAGLGTFISIEGDIPHNTRVTLKFDQEEDPSSEPQTLEAEAVDPNEPREEAGLDWGFVVRPAKNLSAVFTECSYENGYDVSVGLSNQGAPLESMYAETTLPRFKHLLLVVGGRGGLEAAVRQDQDFQALGVTEAKEVFDKWISPCPREARSEEALWASLVGLQRWIGGNR